MWKQQWISIGRWLKNSIIKEWCQRKGGVKDSLGLSIWNYKLINYNITKKSLFNTEACLRDLCTETSKDGQPRINRELRREESSDNLQMHPCNWELTTWAGEGRKPAVAGTSFGQVDQKAEREGESPARVVSRAMTEPADNWQSTIFNVALHCWTVVFQTKK